jgi:hypothetical protein
MMPQTSTARSPPPPRSVCTPRWAPTASRTSSATSSATNPGHGVSTLRGSDHQLGPAGISYSLVHGRSTQPSGLTNAGNPVGARWRVALSRWPWRCSGMPHPSRGRGSICQTLASGVTVTKCAGQRVPAHEVGRRRYCFHDRVAEKMTLNDDVKPPRWPGWACLG